LPEKQASKPVFAPPIPVVSNAPPKGASQQETTRFEQACRDLEADPAFATRPPTREQIGRAWAWAKFQRSDATGWPSHADLVAALKKLFTEYKDPRSSSRSRSSK
jgi:hypothetical protein